MWKPHRKSIAAQRAGLKPCAVQAAVELHAPAQARKPYDTTNRPRRTTRASGARGDYDSARWKRESAAFLVEHPVCACGCGRPSEVVDHIEPVRPVGDPRFFDKSNWQALAKWPCHAQKSADDRARVAGCKPRPIRRRVRIDPLTGYPLAGEEHWWAEPALEKGEN
jgi:5-methylcytosine-specific restriction protein A